MTCKVQDGNYFVPPGVNYINTCMYACNIRLRNGVHLVCVCAWVKDPGNERDETWNQKCKFMCRDVSAPYDNNGVEINSKTITGVHRDQWTEVMDAIFCQCRHPRILFSRASTKRNQNIKRQPVPYMSSKLRKALYSGIWLETNSEH